MNSAMLDRTVLLALCARDIRSSTSALTAAETWQLLDTLSDREQRPRDLVDKTDDGRLSGRLAALDQVEPLIEHYAKHDIWVLTPLEPEYPTRLSERLDKAAPALLYGSGPPGLLGHDGIGVVGSRNLTDEAATVAGTLGRTIATAGLTLISGGARGADHIAMSAAAGLGGSVVGVLAHPLEREALRSDARHLVAERRLCLVTPFKPSAGFRPASAMARNKIIYALTRCTGVVSADNGKGGTWEGATEAMRRGYGPVAVWTGAGAGPGNAPLVERGAHAFTQEHELLGITRDGYTGRPQGVDQLRLGV